jgi:hypothetical protein
VYPRYPAPGVEYEGKKGARPVNNEKLTDERVRELHMAAQDYRLIFSHEESLKDDVMVNQSEIEVALQELIDLRQEILVWRTSAILVK